MPAVFVTVKRAGRADERGAALVTMLLISLLNFRFFRMRDTS